MKIIKPTLWTTVDPAGKQAGNSQASLSRISKEGDVGPAKGIDKHVLVVDGI
jgi:hypothetical protein